MPDRFVLLTRPLDDSRALAERLSGENIPSLIWPLTRIRVATEMPPLDSTVDGLIATSANGIRAFAALCPRRDLPVLAVGPHTAAVARDAGFDRVETARGEAESLIALARESGLRHLCYPRGREITTDLATRLGPPGPQVSAEILYAAEETGPPPARVSEALNAGQIAAIMVWSARNGAILAQHFATHPPAAGLPPFVAISRKAGAALARAGSENIHIAGHPDADAMIAALRNCLDQSARTR